RVHPDVPGRPAPPPAAAGGHGAAEPDDPRAARCGRAHQHLPGLAVHRERSVRPAVWGRLVADRRAQRDAVGALAAILRYIPYVGTAVAGLLPVIFAIAIFPHWRQAFEVIGLYAALEI